MITLPILDKTKVILILIIVVLVGLFGLHYYHLRTSLTSARESLAISATNNKHLQNAYDQLVIDHNAQVTKLSKSINDQNEQIEKFKQNVQAVELASEKAVSDYKAQVKLLQGNLTEYRKALKNRQPIENTCTSGFDFIYSEIKENSSW